MAKSDTFVQVGIMGYDGCSAWITAGLLELFAVANVAARLVGSDRKFRCELIARSKRRVNGSHGVLFTVAPVRRRYHALVVPPLWCESVEELQRCAEKLKSHNRWLTDLARRSRIVASACSGAVLLANAGLLDGRSATTCWWLAAWFGEKFPDITLKSDRLIVKDGDRWTAAAGTAYIHLGLDLIRELAGENTAATAGRLMLVERRRGSQSPFLGQAPPAGTDPLVARATQILEAQGAGHLSVATLSGQLAVTSRTLVRRFRATTATTPLQYLQSRRIAMARTLLEDPKLTLETIVERCGYQDVSSFRKLFTRQVGMTPREYRSRFGAARRD
jgi:transcriptional regulator GlxA family with amidase domain